MSDKTYNGWTNYETWNVALWLDNEQYTQEMMADWAREYRSVEGLRNAIREFVEEDNPIADQATMYTDLLNAALSEVNWHEIAEHYWEDYHEDDEPEDTGDDPEDDGDGDVDYVTVRDSNDKFLGLLWPEDFDYDWHSDTNTYPEEYTEIIVNKDEQYFSREWVGEPHPGLYGHTSFIFFRTQPIE